MLEINLGESKMRKERNQWHTSPVFAHCFPLAESHLSLAFFLLSCSLDQ